MQMVNSNSKFLFMSANTLRIPETQLEDDAAEDHREEGGLASFTVPLLNSCPNQYSMEKRACRFNDRSFSNTDCYW